MHSRDALGPSIYPPRNQTKTIQELATRAHNMELSIAASEVEEPPYQMFHESEDEEEEKEYPSDDEEEEVENGGKAS